ncbi:hypothetical protein ACEPAH_1017 [Sanghuangporus vaninii]
MALDSKSGVLSASAVRSVTPSSEHTTTSLAKGNSATSLLVELFRKSPTNSPKKAGRVMSEKGVGTIETRPDPQQRQPIRETPPEQPCEIKYVELSDLTTESGKKKDLRSSNASSQLSYYIGDKEFEETLAMMDEEQVEGLVCSIPGVPQSNSSSSASSGSSLSRTTSDSTVATSVESSIPGKDDKRRKRHDVDEYPCRRAKPPSERQDIDHTAKKPHSKDLGVQSCELPLTVVASHQKHSKLDRPLPRNLCDPGHSEPITSTTKLAVSSTGGVPGSAHETLTKKLTIQASQVSSVIEKEVIDLEAGDSKRTPAPHPLVTSKVPSSTKCSSPLSAKIASKCIVQSKTITENKVPSNAPIIIAHDQNKQWLLDDEGIAKGVQFEIARGITHGWWTWEDITDGVVKQLRGTNFEKAGKVAEIIGKVTKERLSPSVLATRQAIYAELDREQKAFAEGKGRGLGLMGPWEGKDNWHGGCVQLTAKLTFDKENRDAQSPFAIRLNSFGMGKSNRAARRFTSLSVLQLKFEKEALYDEKKYELVIELLSRNVVICGRLYYAFCTKEGKIFFVETNADYQRQKRRIIGDHFRLSYRRIINAINPLDLNKEQAMNKWLARWQLILSTSRPVVEFEPENIYLDLDDVYGDDTDKDSIMTDGCGWINLSALKQIAAVTNSTVPVVVQGRIAGAKGLWVLHPSPKHRSDTEPPKIWIRRSQLKIKLPRKEDWERALRIFDLVRLPRLTVPSGLNMQTIMNMSHNGVQDKVFVNLMDEGLKKEIEPLTKWDGDNACLLLARAVEEAGGVMSSRRSRAAGGEARLYNFVRDEADDDDDPGTNVGLVERDPISGCPATLYESAYDMLIAGFNPLQNLVLREKLKYILKEAIKSYMEKFHIPVISSAEAFIAPDPYGVLEEGEIYFRCSTPVSDPMISIDPHTFLGPVLVSRNPTRVPSDIRKVIAVSRDQLLSYTDVIIFSTKGKRSLASYLGGGDYDGDTVTIIADPAIVNGFHNSEYIPEPQEVREAFETDVEKVSEFLVKLEKMGREERYARITHKVLHGLSDGKVGLYSHMHDNAIYELGYNNPETIRLAYMFTTCLDSVKSGLRIKDSVFKKDSKRWNAPRPECMQTNDESARNQYRTGVGRRLNRPRNLGPFVLETLKKCAKDLGDKALCDFEMLSDKGESSGLDEDLAKPYYEMKEVVNGLLCDDRLPVDLEEVKKFVESLCEQYIAEVVPYFGEKSPRKNGTNDSASRSRTIAQINREYARRFKEGLSDRRLSVPSRVLREVKASYAHVYGSSKSKMGKAFGFVVAHDTLCALKSLEKGGGSVSRECRDYTLVSSNLVKLVRDD